MKLEFKSTFDKDFYYKYNFVIDYYVSYEGGYVLVYNVIFMPLSIGP